MSFADLFAGNSDNEDYIVGIPEALQMLAHGGVVIDVRTKKHFDMAHIPGSRHIDLQSLIDDPREAIWGHDPLAMLDPDVMLKAIIIFSEHPLHAQALIAVLRAQGFDATFTLKNGLQEWADDGQVLIATPHSS